jgi:hemerythrin-like domain-containing protein
MDWYHVMLDEHLNILVLVNALKAYARKVEVGEEVPDTALPEILDLIRNFADRCHHGKEERALFPVLAGKGSEEKETVGKLLAEHEQGRALVKGMSSDEKEEIISNARGYVALLIPHIIKENKFFRECDGKLGVKEKERLFEEFEKIETEAIGPGMHERYLERIRAVSGALLKQ